MLNEIAMVINVYEIHRYQHDNFQHVVARTKNHTEEYVKKDVEKMNSILSDKLKAQGIKYVFAMGSMTDIINQRTKKSKERTIRTTINSLDIPYYYKDNVIL